MRPNASEVMELIASPAKARELLGWSPQVSLEDGLAQTIEWLRHHRSRYKAELYNV